MAAKTPVCKRHLLAGNGRLVCDPMPAVSAALTSDLEVHDFRVAALEVDGLGIPTRAQFGPADPAMADPLRAVSSVSGALYQIFNPRQLSASHTPGDPRVELALGAVERTCRGGLSQELAGADVPPGGCWSERLAVLGEVPLFALVGRAAVASTEVEGYDGRLRAERERARR
jgi:hypothetical protein